MTRTSVLGGETRSRGLFSSKQTVPAKIARWTVAAVALILVALFQIPGLVFALILAGIVFGATTDTGGGHTVGAWMQSKRRWRHRVRNGLVDFDHIDQRPDEPDAGGTRAERLAASRAWNTYRDWPDGVDNLFWLESRPGTPAVAYHAGAGETPYCAMAFSVDGPIQGLHGDTYVAQAQEAFGRLMAGWGAGQRLVSGIQVVTRVMPADSAFHEAWLQDQLDPDAPQDLQADYALLLTALSTSSFVQRHYVVIRWDVDGQFKAAAARRMPGLAGWLDVVTGQGETAHRRLEDAMYRDVHALSGPQLAAVLRHMQHPGWSIDRAGDATVDNCWLPSHDEKTHTVVTEEYPDPMDPDWLMPPTSWYHRTAQIPAAALEVRAVDGLWLTPILTGMDEQIIRTFSTHIRFVPAREAKVAARRDATTDSRDLMAAERKGQMVDDETELALSSSQRRLSALREGAGHHGAYWAAFVTVSAQSADELDAACALIEEAADDAGISKLDWLDTQQSAAHATTWPVGRGMTIPTKSLTSRTLRKVSVATAKETITA